MPLSDKISNIIGVGIPRVILDQLNFRAQQNSQEKRSVINTQYLENKTAWVRLVSSIDVDNEQDRKYFQRYGLNLTTPSSLAKEFVLFGGTSKYIKDNAYQLRSGILQSGDAYSILGNREIQDYGYRPMPGITNVSVESQGRLGSIRAATINFKCSDKYQLDVIDTLYFKLGFTMFLEWGHTFYYENSSRGGGSLLSSELMSINPFQDGLTKEEIQRKISKANRASQGNYDAILGMVTNFDFSMNAEGGYDCTLKLISLGILAESIKINNFASGPNILTEELNQYIAVLNEENRQEAIKSIETGGPFDITLFTEQNLLDYVLKENKSEGFKLFYGSDVASQTQDTADVKFKFNEGGDDWVNTKYLYVRNATGEKFISYGSAKKTASLHANKLKGILNSIGVNLGKKGDWDKLSYDYTLSREYKKNGRTYKIEISADRELEVQFMPFEEGSVPEEVQATARTWDPKLKTAKKIVNITASDTSIELDDPDEVEDIYSMGDLKLKEDEAAYKQKYGWAGANDEMAARAQNKFFNEYFYGALEKQLNPFNLFDSGWTDITTWLSQEPKFEFTVAVQVPLTVDLEVEYVGPSSEEDDTDTVDTVGTVFYISNVSITITDTSLISEISTDQPQPGEKKPEPVEGQPAPPPTEPTQGETPPTPQPGTGDTKPDGESTEDAISKMSALELSLYAIKIHSLNKSRSQGEDSKDVFSTNLVETGFYRKLFSTGVFRDFIDDLVLDNIDDTDYENTKDSKKRFKVTAKYGFATNLMTGFTPLYEKISGLYSYNFKKVDFGEMLTTYMVPYNFAAESPNLGDKTEKPVYITLGSLLMILNSNCIIYDTDSAEGGHISTPLIYIDFNPNHNFCASAPYHISTNPWNVLIPFEGTDLAYASIFPLEILKADTAGNPLIDAPSDGSSEPAFLFKPTSLAETNGDKISNSLISFKFSKASEGGASSYKGAMMNILLNVDYLCGIVRSISDNNDENKVFLKEFIEQVISDLNKYLGNINIFRMSYNDPANCLQLIDDQMIPTQDEKQLNQTSVEDFELPLFGKNSIAKSLNIKTEVSNRLSNMIAISANANKKVANGNDGSSFGEINRGFKDRYITEKGELKPSGSIEDPTAKRDSLIGLAVQFNSAIKLIYGPKKEPSKDLVEAATNYYAERMSELRSEDPVGKASAMIPLTIDFTTDGIAGLSMGQAFTIPKNILPYTYSPDRTFPTPAVKNKVGFVIMGLSNTISNNTWITTVKGSMIFLKDPAIKPVDKQLNLPISSTPGEGSGTPPVESGDPPTGNVITSDLTINEKGEYALWESGKITGYKKMSQLGNGSLIREDLLKNYGAMAEAAKKSGITLVLSSGFRTYDSQYRLRRNNVKDKTKTNDANYLKTASAKSFYVETGKPGYSNHQNGVAFDISVKKQIPTFEWLAANAEKFGFVRTVPSERWHWEYRPGWKKYQRVPEGHWSWKREA